LATTTVETSHRPVAAADDAKALWICDWSPADGSMAAVRPREFGTSRSQLWGRLHHYETLVGFQQRTKRRWKTPLTSVSAGPARMLAPSLCGH